MTLQYKDLISIKTKDCREEFLSVSASAPEIIVAPHNSDMEPYTSNLIYIREGAVVRLKMAAEHLRKSLPGAKLKLVYGYRHPDIQKRYFDNYFGRSLINEPNLSEFERRSNVHLLVASPDVAGHPTRGAVDVTIVKDGCEFAMGTPLLALDMPNLIPTFTENISPKARENRLLL
ncbi:MAG: hypothetical protein SGJ02_05475 [bacterium]|nr:hypothetical protein [bacterium]